MKNLTTIPNALVVKFGKGKKQFTPVENLEQASAIVKNFINSKGLGASQWYGEEVGFVFDHNGAKVGHISYNGRIWPNE